MARPEKSRFICQMPRHLCFHAETPSATGIHLTVEEFEVIRLSDYLGMTQAECAAQMNISRTTVQALYSEARKKLARFLVEGTFLEIRGGNYQLCPSASSSGSPECTKCSRRQRQPVSLRTVSDTIKNSKSKGVITVKIAVTYESGQVFQHFGHTEQFKVYDVEDGKIVSSEIVNTNGQGHGALAGFLFGGGVDVLICGGIGGGARNALAEAGIRLYPGAVGDADAQVESFLKGTLNYDPDTMCNHHGEGHTCGDHEDGHSCGDHGCH